MKKKILIALGIILMCTGCGSKNSTMGVNADDYENDAWDAAPTEAAMPQEAVQSEGFGEDYLSSDSAAGSMLDMDGEETANTAAAADVEGGASKQTNPAGGGKLSKEMLIYRGNLQIDTLDFEASVNAFKALLNEKGGFVEDESYSDNGDSGYYFVEESEKHNNYQATVRVPSAEYDSLMNSASAFGDVRSKSSNASNVTQQYSSYKSQLEVYEAQYSRYLSLLEKAEEDEYALQIENKLFEIQVEIANLKSGIANIENDVVYSYINISINEVSKYEKEPAPKDTFLDRLKSTCSDSWTRFLLLLEELIFYIIMNIYYIVILLVIIFFVIRAIRNKKRKKAGNTANLETEKTGKAVHLEGQEQGTAEQEQDVARKGQDTAEQEKDAARKGEDTAEQKQDTAKQEKNREKTEKR